MPPAAFTSSMAALMSGTSMMSEGMAPAGAFFGRVAITRGVDCADFAVAGDPELTMISLNVAELAARRVSDMPKAFS